MVMVKVTVLCDDSGNRDNDYCDDDYGKNEDTETFFCF